MKPTHRVAAVVGLAMLLLTATITATAALASEGVVNINTASESQLMLLPRVGPSLAKKIVEYRQANGEFKAPDELVMVPGIGDKTYELMAPYISVKGDTTLKEKAKGSVEPKAAAAPKPEAEKTGKEGA
jgi:competence protein ComEA